MPISDSMISVGCYSNWTLRNEFAEAITFSGDRVSRIRSTFSVKAARQSLIKFGKFAQSLSSIVLEVKSNE